MATSNVTLIVNAAQAVNPLRQVTAETKKLEGATRDVNGRLRDAKGRFVGTGQSATKASKGVNKLKGAVSGLLGAFTAIQTAKFVLFKTAELERQTKSLEVLTGSLGNARNIISELQKFGAVTPFTSSELIETAKRLKAFGFETENIVDVTKRLADVAGATGADLGGIATAFGQIQAKGRLQGEELLQLQERGINLQDELQKMYGLTSDEFRKALEGGKFSADAVNLALQNLTEAGGKYADGAIAQSETLAGKFSTLVDGIERIAVTIGNTISPILKAVLDDTTIVINSIVTMMNQAAMANKVGLSQGEQQKLFRQASTEAEQMQRRRQGLPATGFAFGALNNEEFLRLRNERFDDLIQQAGFKSGALKAPVSAAPLTNVAGVPALLGGNPPGGTTAGPTSKPDMSQKLFDLNNRLLGQEGEISELERLSLEFQIAKQKVLEAGHQPRNEAIKLLETEVNFEKQLLDFRQKGIDADNKQKQKAEKERKKMEAAEQKRRESDPGFQMQKQLDELLKLENQVAAGATAIGSAFSNAFVSVVTGSKSAKEALADMMSAVAEHFMNMAAQIIAKQLAMILYGTIMKALGISSEGFGVGVGDVGAVNNNAFATLGNTAAFGEFAEGGYVSSPTNALIGEGGEPEYVIPESKMRTAMSRYSRGSRGGSVIPESGAAEAVGEAGGTAVAAAIDVRYTVERINSIDYVTADQFQTGMQQAAQQGAKQGEQQTLKRLQMSGSTRKRIGI